MNKRRLVFVWNYLSWGGAQVYFLAIMKLARKDWEIIVHLPKASSPEILEYVKQLGVEYRLVDHQLDLNPALGIANKLRRQLNRIKVERRTLEDLKQYDVRDTVFQIEVAPWQSVSFLKAMSRRGAQVFLTMHNFLPDAPSWRKAIWKRRLQFVSRLRGLHIFASNVDTKNRLRGWVNEKFWETIRVTSTAVNPPQIDEALALPFDKSSRLEQVGISTDDFIVLAVGQFIDRKGRWVYLDAARQIIESDVNDITFIWLTPQMPTKEEQEKIDSFGLGDKFRIVHSPSLGSERLDVLSFFRVADVFTLPSYVEGLPIALLEAMALERPSISTNVYAIPEAVKDNETGLLIDAGDAEGLADAILKLKNDPGLRARLAAEGRKFVIEHFDERDAAATAIAAYEDALSRS